MRVCGQVAARVLLAHHAAARFINGPVCVCARLCACVCVSVCVCVCV